jgi:hypothetical protein
VKLDTHEHAAMAIVQLQGQMVHGRPIKCSWGKDRTDGTTAAQPATMSPTTTATPYANMVCGHLLGNRSYSFWFTSAYVWNAPTQHLWPVWIPRLCRIPGPSCRTTRRTWCHLSWNATAIDRWCCFGLDWGPSTRCCRS